MGKIGRGQLVATRKDTNGQKFDGSKSLKQLHFLEKAQIKHLIK